LLTSFDRLISHFTAGRKTNAFDSLRARLENVRDRRVPARRRIEFCLGQFRRQIRQVENHFRRWDPDEMTTELMIVEFQRTYRRVRRAARRACTTKTDGDFHEWRKQVKYHRYQLRLLRAAYPTVVKIVSRELDQLSDHLGDDHDLGNLLALLRRDAEVCKHPSFEPLIEFIDAHRRSLRASAIRAGARLFVDRPETAARRMRIWWDEACAESSLPHSE
jgi:CHAD domain-containing protein